MLNKLGYIILFVFLCGCQQNPLLQRITDVTNDTNAGKYGPVIQNISPHIPVLGDTVTVTGKNFGASQGSSTLIWGTSQLITTVISWNNTTITFTLPVRSNPDQLVITTPYGSTAVLIRQISTKPYIIKPASNGCLLIHTGLLRTGCIYSVSGSGTITTLVSGSSYLTTGIGGDSNSSNGLGHLQQLLFGYCEGVSGLLNDGTGVPGTIVAEESMELLIDINGLEGTYVSGQYNAVIVLSMR